MWEVEESASVRIYPKWELVSKIWICSIQILKTTTRIISNKGI